MRYRKLDANGDRVFGGGITDFYVDRKEAVAQAVRTRLLLWLGEWFNDTTQGTDWMGRILGTGTQGTYDAELQARVLGTEGVLSLDSYSSTVDRNTRRLTVQGAITTTYGAITVTQALIVRPPVVSPLAQPTELTAVDGTLLTGRDGAILFDPRLPLP